MPSTSKRLRLWADERDVKLKASMSDDLRRAADELDRLKDAAERAIKIIDTNLHHQREKVSDATAILRAALANA